MSNLQSLLERLGLAIHGEDPKFVMEVLPIFARVCCERFGMKIEDFVAAMLHASPVPLAPKSPPD